MQREDSSVINLDDVTHLRTRIDRLEDFIIRRSYPDEFFDVDEDFDLCMTCFRARGEHLLECEWRDEQSADNMKKYAPKKPTLLPFSEQTRTRLALVALIAGVSVFWVVVTPPVLEWFNTTYNSAINWW